MSKVTSSLAEVFSDVLHRLAENGLEYMVVGSIASAYYGEPRLTRDMDLVIDFLAQDLPKLIQAFPEHEYYLPPLEVLTDERVRRGQFNLIHASSGLKVDFVFRKNAPHALEEFARRQKVELWPGVDAWIASPEEVILKKLEFYQEGGSEKHLRDISGILAQAEVDLSYITRWARDLGLESEWKQAQQA